IIQKYSFDTNGLNGSKKGQRGQKLLEAISELVFSFKVKKDPSFQPQEDCRISRTGNEDPTPRWGEKTILR
ncbi:MAG: hypothetical protein LJE65_01155, partial [Desulfobacteraceae bacterium]|nr:hypothetical protein [Desulfobacteraceae bacterium]